MPRTVDEIREIADRRFYRIQDRLVRIQDEQKREIASLISEMKTWESWLGAVSFSLAAISGTVLASPFSNYWALTATILFLTAGVWTAVVAKKRFDKASLSLLEETNADIALELKERDVVWELSMHPELENELGPKINQISLEKMRSDLKSEKAKLNRMQKERIDVSNEIRLGIVITGIYLLMIPTLITVLRQLKVASDLIPLALSVPWFILVIFFTYDTVKTALEKNADKNSHIKRKQQNIVKIKKFADDFEKELSIRPY